MRQKTFYRAGAVLLTVLLLIASVVPPCFAAGTVGEVNLHIGQTADTVYLTYTSSEETAKPVVVHGPDGKTTYTADSTWWDDAGKYMHTAKLDRLVPGTEYSYSLEDGAYSNAFTTAATEGPFTFAYLTDPQVAHTADSRAVGAMFEQANGEDPAFVYIAGDFTDSRTEHQWELLFENAGKYRGAGQRLLGSRLLSAVQGNHDRSSFNGHITAPSAGESVGNVVYSFDYSNVKFIVLNMNHDDTWDAQAQFLRREAAEAKAAEQWIIVGFHQSLYSGAGHLTEKRTVAARKYWAPLLAEAGVDLVLQGHDHVYARGFVTARGRNAGLGVLRNAYPAGSGAPLYITGGESGAVKWYSAENYTVQAGDPLAPNCGFLDINSAVPARNPWGTSTSEQREQTYIIISVDGDEMYLRTHMFRYDVEEDRFITEPYLYDSLFLHRDAALDRDKAVLTRLPAASWNAGRAAVPMTRGMAVTELYRMAGSPSGAGQASFPDVKAGTELARAVSWAAGNGIAAGYADGSFQPQRTVTRAQFAAFAYRYAQAVKITSQTGSGVGTYRDWREVPSWAGPALSWAVHTGLLQGRSGNLLAPNAQINCAEGDICFRRLQFLSV